MGAPEIRDGLPFDRLIDELRAAFIGGTEAPPRHHHQIRGPQGEDGILLLMPAWAGGLLGTKISTVYPANGKKALPTVYSNYLLCDASTGAPLALLDGDELTARRTIAVSALAASFLAREGAQALLVIGAGRIGALAASAFSAVRPIRDVKVWSRNQAQAEALAATLRSAGFAAGAIGDLADAVARADIISCATPSREPIVRGDWLRPGAHLDLIGSFTPAMREADDGCFRHARIAVDTLDALSESGDLVGPIAAGIIDARQIATLGDLCAERVTARRSADDITIFKSVGSAIADLAAASLVHVSQESSSHQHG